MRKALAISIFILLLGCIGRQQNLSGIYVVKNDKHNYDSLILYPNGRYEQSLYRKYDSLLIFRNSNTWTKNKDRLEIKKLYINFGIKHLDSLSYDALQWGLIDTSIHAENGELDFADNFIYSKVKDL